MGARERAERWAFNYLIGGYVSTHRRVGRGSRLLRTSLTVEFLDNSNIRFLF